MVIHQCYIHNLFLLLPSDIRISYCRFNQSLVSLQPMTSSLCCLGSISQNEQNPVKKKKKNQQSKLPLWFAPKETKL